MYKIIKEWIRRFVIENDTDNLFDEPLVECSSTSNALFSDLKLIAHNNHCYPNELLSDCRSVFVYFIPYKKHVVSSNIHGSLASELWAKAYINANTLIENLNQSISKKIIEYGYQCVTISATHNFNADTLTSYWSHKHIAFICGLGSFGLHQMIITEKGCCGRLSSFVTNIPISDYFSKPSTINCLYFKENSCTQCMSRCVTGSLSLENFNRHLCYNQCLTNKEKYLYLGIADVCGKCMVGVPCSTQKPRNVQLIKLE
ncbi:MAG: hypothetical protein N2449_00240 [Bacteroidales bacterium]|nr:hypothetical protein [Bacteroidales bacterium]